MIIAQITDAHVTRPGTRLPGGTDPHGALARTLAALKALDPRPDIVLFTGDLVETGAPEEYAAARALLDTLDLPLAVIPGNHDRRGPFAAAFADGPVRAGSGDFLHLAIEHLPLRLIGLDTLGPEGASRGLLCDTRLGWLASTLDAAPEQPTLIFMHHPPFETGIAAMDAINCANGDRLAALLAPRRNVLRVLCGHVHRPVHAAFGGTIASVCPAIVHQAALRLAPDSPIAMLPQPPAYQLHVLTAGGLVTHTVQLPD
jgi:3',5'-cyclic AMP phosphodiesterase CpdA